MKTGSEFHVGIVGLGSMGMGAALSCVRAGLSTWGADLNSNACATLKEAGACGVSDNAATFAEKLDALLVLVVNAAQVKQVLFGETGVAQHLKPGTAVMVSSTIASADARLSNSERGTSRPEVVRLFITPKSAPLMSIKTAW